MDPVVSSYRPLNAPVKQVRSPFPCDMDGHLLDQIVRIRELYDEGKRSFVIATHRDPDPDAIAGCLGMEYLIRAVTPGPVSIRWMHEGTLSSALKHVTGKTTEPIAHLESAIEDHAVAIVVVDQPDLNLCTMLPQSLRDDARFKNRFPDIVLDHHGEARYDQGRISFPEAGSTAALVCRLLDLAHMYSLVPKSLVLDDVANRLPLLLNMGARTDAGVSVVGELPSSVSPYTRWVVEQTQAKVDPADAALFDILKTHDSHLLEKARAHERVRKGIVIGGVLAEVVLTHAGVADSPHCVGACASELFREKLAHRKGPERVVVIMFGIIRPEGAQEMHELHKGETIHVSIRTEEGISAEHIARRLSSIGGGRPSAAGFQLQVPENFEHVSDEIFLGHCLSLASVKLTWREQFSWNLDTN
jgi:nanoRNase/pAp phosphatase (c-di-AMP/oligoRNAs hydrolase)